MSKRSVRTDIFIITEANIRSSGLPENKDHVHGAILQGSTLLIEYKSKSGNSSYVSSFRADNEDEIVGSHYCMATSSGRPCWHLAVAKSLLEIISGATLSNRVTLRLENISLVPVGGADVTMLYYGKELVSDKLAPDRKWMPTINKMTFNIQGNSQGKETVRADIVAHPDDLWLKDLNLPSPLLERCVAFREMQRERLSERPDLIELVPNLGAKNKRLAYETSLALTMPDVRRLKYTLDYVSPGQEVAWALSPLLYDSWEPILMTGHAGTRKTIMGHFLASVLMLPLAIFSGNAQTSTETMLGEKEIDPDSEKMIIKHVPGIVLDAIQEGKLLVFNEINQALPDIISVLNDILDFQKSTYIHGVGRVDVSPFFRFVATRNKGYVGTSEMNQALIDRCKNINAEYPNAMVIEKIIAKEVPGVDPEVSQALAKLYDNLTTATNSSDSRIGPEHVSLRNVIRAAKDSMYFGAGHYVILKNLTANIEDDAATEAIKQLVDALFDQNGVCVGYVR